MSLTWSNVAISAALIMEFRMMLGPIPVHNPAILRLFKNVPFGFDYLDVGIGYALVPPLILRLISLALEPDFYNIGRVGHHDAHCSSSQGRENSGENGDGTDMVFPDVESLNWLIESDTQTGEHHLPLKTRIEPLIEGGNSLLLDHGADAVEHARILASLGLHLESDLGGVQGDCQDLG